MVRHAWNLLHQKARHARWTWNFLSSWWVFYIYIPAKRMLCCLYVKCRRETFRKGLWGWWILRNPTEKNKVLFVLRLEERLVFWKVSFWRAPVFFKGFPSCHLFVSQKWRSAWQLEFGLFSGPGWGFGICIGCFDVSDGIDS